ncbi:TPA: hypothetical protein R2P05_002009 [Campylobacter jejuni]|nr:hypothetical protein [Campylobacter jejuni]EFN6207559.1 hypothetical protein [Campylobacter jejuni]HEC2935553.1 hypothetical protein [Campylobacter jejuni]HEC2940825.1 hypothetical protein [Campylobacter jejuni]HEC2942701.1 hypothetical protein [Campylobacter jejuni]
MILVTPCGVIDTTNFSKSEINRQTIDFSLKAEAKKEKQSNSTNTDKADNKKDQLLDISA